MTYKFHSTNGFILYSDYTYTGFDQTCQESTKNKLYYLKTQPSYSSANGFDLMLAQLAKGPLTVGVHATYWIDYASGIFNGACSGVINHAAILTAVGS